MTTKPLLPQVFWFRMAAPCLRVDEIPRAAGSPRLLDLPEECSLPDWGQLDGIEPWAKVRAAWNPEGLGIAVLADGVSPLQLNSERPEAFAVVQFWIDTRDTRDVSRATRFCHRIFARVQFRARRLSVDASARPIARAQADAPLCKPELIRTHTELGKSAWMLELFLPAQCFNGFDPDVNRRLGFAYQIADYVRPDQFLGVGREFPVGENPSLWSTLELCD
jgi:hypothetical protein